MTRREIVLEKLFEAMKKQEGWYVGSRSWRHRNPLNLRRSPFASWYAGNFAGFWRYETGRKAALWDLNAKLDKATTNPLFREKGMKATLKELIFLWTPPVDNGKNGLLVTQNYLNGVIKSLNEAGVNAGADSTFEELFNESQKELKILAVLHNIPIEKQATLHGLLGSTVDYLSKSFEGQISVSLRELNLPNTIEIKKLLTYEHGELTNELSVYDLNLKLQGSLEQEEIILYIYGGTGKSRTYLEPLNGKVFSTALTIPMHEDLVLLETLVHELCHAIHILIRHRTNNFIEDTTHNFAALQNLKESIALLKPYWNLL